MGKGDIGSAVFNTPGAGPVYYFLFLPGYYWRKRIFSRLFSL